MCGVSHINIKVWTSSYTECMASSVTLHPATIGKRYELRDSLATCACYFNHNTTLLREFYLNPNYRSAKYYRLDICSKSTTSHINNILIIHVGMYIQISHFSNFLLNSIFSFLVKRYFSVKCFFGHDSSYRWWQTRIFFGFRERRMIFIYAEGKSRFADHVHGKLNVILIFN